MPTSYDVRIYAIETRKGRATGYRVRWTVAGKRFGETFAAKGVRRKITRRVSGLRFVVWYGCHGCDGGVAGGDVRGDLPASG